MIYPYGLGGGYLRRYREMLSRFGIKIIAEPDGEQISLAQAYAHLRLTPDGSPPTHPDDDWLTTVGIPASREYCEQETERALATQTIEMALNGFPGGYLWPSPSFWYRGIDGRFHNGIPLPFSPVQQVVSVIYTDGDGNDQTVDPATYTLDGWSPTNILNLASDQTAWPTPAQMPNAVRVQYVAGYSLPDDSPDVNPLPRSVRAAMLLALGHFYENREASNDLKLAELPIGISNLLERYRLRLSMA